MLGRLLHWYDIATKRVLAALSHPFLLAFRLYFGYQFFLAGKGKLGNIEGVTRFFDSLGIPAPGFHAYFVGGLEMVGGVLLMVGLGSRLTAIPLSIAMVVAYLTADRDAVAALLTDPELFLGAAPWNFLVTSLMVAIFGPGLFSLDALARRVVARRARERANA
jgi:putative oxidoreductase